jgi:arylsulfatase
LIIAHPAAKAGATCLALTSHLDLLPTFVGLTGLPDANRPQGVKALPGYDFSALLADPDKVGLAAVDAEFLRATMVALVFRSPAPPLSQAKLDKRGFLSFVYDGRYKFARYYAPTAFNTPRTLEKIFSNNDAQLLDLQNDPEETHNLALEPDNNRALILRMNELLNDLFQHCVRLAISAADQHLFQSQRDWDRRRVWRRRSARACGSHNRSGSPWGQQRRTKGF